jgi:multiple sugar transport system ATP-binding protein
MHVGYLNLGKLKKVYPNGTVAVQDLDLEIRQGEFMVFLGPSGCGKTTTLRMIAGLEQVTEGSIVLDGRDITYLAPRERNVSMIFQSYAVWPHMTVAENIAYPLKLRKLARSAIDSKVGHVAGVCGISEYLGRYPAQLSGGQRQRVAVARALAVESKLSLMDEPLSNLDAKLRVSVRTFLKEIHRQSGATTIFVTHDQAEAMALADRIVVMNGGQVEQVGTTREIYNDCGSLFTAQFMGTPPANIKTVTIEVRDGGLFAVADSPAGHVTLRLGKAADAPDAARFVGKNVCLAVRPEIMSIDREPGMNDVTIDVVEPQGAYTILVTTILDSEWKVMVEGDPDLKPGQVVSLAIDTARMMLFDPESGRRL